MSEENLEAFHRGTEAWRRGDLEEWLRHVHADGELHPSAAEVEGSAYRGLDGARQFWADIKASFDGLGPEFDEIQDLGDAVLGLGRLRGRSKEGFPVDMEYAVLMRYRDGLVIWARSWFSHADALKAAGASA